MVLLLCGIILMILDFDEFFIVVWSTLLKCSWVKVCPVLPLSLVNINQTLFVRWFLINIAKVKWYMWYLLFVLSTLYSTGVNNSICIQCLWLFSIPCQVPLLIHLPLISHSLEHQHVWCHNFSIETKFLTSSNFSSCVLFLLSLLNTLLVIYCSSCWRYQLVPR